LNLGKKLDIFIGNLLSLIVFVLVLGFKFGSLMFLYVVFRVVCFNVRESRVVFSTGSVNVGPVK
jgi:hypothetical protein